MPGLANRLVGKWVKAAAINFPAAAKWFRNAEVTGVPVRQEFFSLQAPTGAPHLLVFGGSQGARIFNMNLPHIIKSLLEAAPGLTVLHQSGERNFEATHAAYAASGADPARWVVRPFVTKMGAEFARAHLIMSRSGATTVAEEAAAGKPALLVPFAAATDEHQRRNAEAMVTAGAAVMLEEKDLGTPDKLLWTLAGLIADPARLAAMGAAARTQAHPGAAERIADRLAEMAGKQVSKSAS
jgi:UDP-N-acetylglucosamine--N-acetylmuramyl-(pentapeptide) pyrophosphoryl-undecaprenol N-acetylglucosamine transferase